LELLKSLPNVTLRYSSDSITGEYEQGLHGSTVIIPDNVPDGVFLCKASATSTNCNGCRACWDKNVSVIGYVGHGRALKKEYKRIALKSV